jgi:hypothetical protein
MIKSLSALLLVFSASPVLSFDLQSVDVSALKAMEPAAVELPAAPKAASQYVWMSVRNNPSFKEAEANDYGNRIEARVRETFTNSFDVTMRTDSNSSWASIRKTGSYYTLSGAGLYLSMSGSNGSYFVNGNVSENGKTTLVSVNISKRFDDFSYNVFGSGINLYTDRNSINGNYDTDRFSKKALGAITSLVLAVQVEKGQPKPEQKSVKNSERIWLTIRPGFGWNTVEASDPFSRIEVGLRKIFDREYDVEIETDNNRFSARASGFFTRRYELRGGRTDLRMEEWAGSWTLSGKVETQGGQNQEQAVKLELRDRFGDGSFYIWTDAINLTIDRNGVNGTVDTKVYPKEVVGAITALVMAWQQDNPNPR